MHATCTSVSIRYDVRTRNAIPFYPFFMSPKLEVGNEYETTISLSLSLPSFSPVHYDNAF